MTIARFALTATITSFLAFPLYLISEVAGAEAGRTGGPFPGERSCGDGSQCHNTTPNTGPGSVAILVNGAPIDQYRYTPGETVDLIIRVADPNQGRWGFQVTARSEGDGCQSQGSLAPAGGDNIRVQSGTPVGPCAGPQYATHGEPKLGFSPQDFHLSWTAPATNVGPLVFAAAGNAANGNNQSSGDRIYTTSTVVQPSAPAPPPPTPSISEGGVLNGGSLLPGQGFAPNGFISVFGQNLTQGTAVWDAAFQNGRAPTSLQGTQVLINGKQAYVAFVGDGNDLGRGFDQINLVAPDDEARGPVSLEVISSGVRSAPFSITLEDKAPAFFPFDPQGRKYLAAIQNDGSAFIGPTDLFGGADLGRPILPAKPGDIAALYFSGGGLTNPPVPAGMIPSPGVAAATVSPFRVFFGNTEAEVFFSGLSGFVGLYQVVLRVPDVPDGDSEVIGEMDGMRTQTGLFMAIRR